MPTGKYVTDEDKARILKYKSQGLTRGIISVRTGLHPGTISEIVRKEKLEKEVEHGTCCI